MNQIRTFTGKHVDPLNLKPDDVDILDLAHSLSLLCRYNGHSKGFYSVAQHSVMVALAFRDDDNMTRRTALLHDAGEAYLGDMVSPVKHRQEFMFFRDVERRIDQVIADKFDLHFPEPIEIKDEDRLQLAVEQMFIYTEDRGWSPTQAESMFLMQWRGCANG